MIVLHNPKKKATNFVAKITNENGKLIRVKISNCKPVYLKEQPSGGHLLRIIIPKELEEYKEIEKIDSIICQNALINNQKWFNNNLHDEEIKEFFRASLNIVQDTMTVMISDIKDIIITLNDTVIDTLEEIDLKNPNIEVSLEIEAQGLYFFPKKFGIRWIVNKITIYNADLVEKVDNDDAIDRDSIENEWKQEVGIIQESIKNDISKLKNKITFLQEYSNDIENSFQKATQINSIEQWNTKFIELSHKITKYYGGITREDVQ